MSERSARWRRLLGASLVGSVIVGVLVVTPVAGARPLLKHPTKGTITCTDVEGTITFHPPLTDTTKRTKVKAALKLANAGCVASSDGADQGQAAVASRGRSVGRSTAQSSSVSKVSAPLSCSYLTGAEPVPSKWTTRWTTPAGTAPSVVHFSGSTAVADPSGKVDLTFPGPNGTASATGSYQGTDGGTSSTLELSSTLTLTRLTNMCAQGGVSSLTVSSGMVFVG